MAHETTITGAISEFTALRALMAVGYEVAKPSVAEVYDLVGKHPITGEWQTFQVKTINRRFDRKGEYVISGRKSNGTNYSPQECDFIVGVDGDDVYMTPCKGFAEYWASESTIANRWKKLNENNGAEAV